MSEPRLRVAVAEDDREVLEYLQEVLPRLGCEVLCTADTGKGLAAAAREARPDLVITDIKMPDMDGIEAAAAINRDAAVPVILLSGHFDEELVSRAAAANVMSYLVKPVGEADLRAAIPLAMARFRQIQGLSGEAAALRQSLEDRKAIEKAKGVVMKRLRMDEPDAFRRLRMLASSQNRKLVEMCQQVNAADEVFAQLEAVAVAGAR
jgi:response regulator NasT